MISQPSLSGENPYLVSIGRMFFRVESFRYNEGHEEKSGVEEIEQQFKAN